MLEEEEDVTDLLGRPKERRKLPCWKSDEESTR
jgi:hypothetical protein